MSVQPSSTIIFGVPFPLPTPQGRWALQLKTMPEREIQMLRKATPRTWRPLRQIIKEGVPGLQRGPEAKVYPPHPQAFRTQEVQ